MVFALHFLSIGCDNLPGWLSEGCFIPGTSCPGAIFFIKKEKKNKKFFNVKESTLYILANSENVEVTAISKPKKIKLKPFFKTFFKELTIMCYDIKSYKKISIKGDIIAATTGVFKSFPDFYNMRIPLKKPSLTVKIPRELAGQPLQIIYPLDAPSTKVQINGKNLVLKPGINSITQNSQESQTIKISFQKPPPPGVFITTPLLEDILTHFTVFLTKFTGSRNPKPGIRLWKKLYKWASNNSTPGELMDIIREEILAISNRKITFRILWLLNKPAGIGEMLPAEKYAQNPEKGAIPVVVLQKNLSGCTLKEVLFKLAKQQRKLENETPFCFIERKALFPGEGKLLKHCGIKYLIQPGPLELYDFEGLRLLQIPVIKNPYPGFLELNKVLKEATSKKIDPIFLIITEEFLNLPFWEKSMKITGGFIASPISPSDALKILTQGQAVPYQPATWQSSFSPEKIGINEVFKFLKVKSLPEILKQINTIKKPGTPVVIFNPAPVPITLPVGIKVKKFLPGPGVTDKSGITYPAQMGIDGKLRFIVNLPPLGYKTYWIRTKMRFEDSVKVNGTIVRNSFLEVKFNPVSGDIESITNLSTGKCVFSGPVQIIPQQQEEPGFSSTSLLEAGPLYVNFKVEKGSQNKLLKANFYIYGNLPSIFVKIKGKGIFKIPISKHCVVKGSLPSACFSVDKYWKTCNGWLSLTEENTCFALLFDNPVETKIEKNMLILKWNSQNMNMIFNLCSHPESLWKDSIKILVKPYAAIVPRHYGVRPSEDSFLNIFTVRSAVYLETEQETLIHVFNPSSEDEVIKIRTAKFLWLGNAVRKMEQLTPWGGCIKIKVSAGEIKTIWVE